MMTLTRQAVRHRLGFIYFLNLVGFIVPAVILISAHLVFKLRKKIDSEQVSELSSVATTEEMEAARILTSHAKWLQDSMYVFFLGAVAAITTALLVTFTAGLIVGSVVLMIFLLRTVVGYYKALTYTPFKIMGKEL